MNVLNLLWSIVVFLAKALAYKWVFSLVDLIKRLLSTWKDLCASFDLPHPRAEDPGKDCTQVDTPSYHRPDPCIYSQDYLMKLGLAVTWDNPDIVIRRNGVIVAENDLLPDTEYEIDATVWNNSYDAPAPGLKVLFSFLSFGVGTVNTTIGTTFVNLGVKGGVNHPASAQMLWKTPPTPGHYCLQVLLNWFDDANPGNNLGQNNLDVVAAHSPAQFTFNLKNRTGKESRFRFETDTYTLPQQPQCPAKIDDAGRGPLSKRLRAIRARHNRQDFPIPTGWSVALTPAEPVLAPDAEIAVKADITPPAGFTGNMPFNVNAFAGNTFAGGVTLIVTKS